MRSPEPQRDLPKDSPMLGELGTGLELSHSSLTVAVAGQGDRQYGVDCLVF